MYIITWRTKMLRKLPGIRLKAIENAYVMPKMITFLEMMGAGKVEHLNPLKRWKESDPVKSLAVPVGVAADGSPFLLDLHEKYSGPSRFDRRYDRFRKE